MCMCTYACTLHMRLYTCKTTHMHVIIQHEYMLTYILHVYTHMHDIFHMYMMHNICRPPSIAT